MALCVDRRRQQPSVAPASTHLLPLERSAREGELTNRRAVGGAYRGNVRRARRRNKAGGSLSGGGGIATTPACRSWHGILA
jgi:hypothetical protein